MPHPVIKSVILASGSLRRRELLAEAGYDAEVIPPSDSAECGLCSGESAPMLVARLAWQKAEDVVRRVSATERRGRPIIACDTVAEYRGTILGKPADEDHARRILQTLSGNVHRVYSGLCVWPAAGEPLAAVDHSELQMRELGPHELDEYLATGLWEGKAGAFGLQDRPDWLQLLSGSESNVVGLPMPVLEKLLHELSKRPQQN